MATTAVGEFWEKFHYYHRLQAELEKLYLWFEEFEQTLARDNQELERILSGYQAISGLPAEILGKPTARQPTRSQAGRRSTPAKSR